MGLGVNLNGHSWILHFSDTFHHCPSGMVLKWDLAHLPLLPNVIFEWPFRAKARFKCFYAERLIYEVQSYNFQYSNLLHFMSLILKYSYVPIVHRVLWNGTIGKVAGGDIYSWLSRCITARGSSTMLYLVGPTKLFIIKSLRMKRSLVK